MTDCLVTYAGIPLGAATYEQARLIAAYIPLSDVASPVVPDWPGRAVMGTMRPDRLPDREVWRRLGTLWWPVGASRFAIGHFIATQEQVAAMRPLAARGKALPLRISDGSNNITTNLWLLPPRPLSGIPGLYLCSFADDRLWWWQRAAAITVTAGTTTWAELYTDLGIALGVTITPDTINAAYLMPTADLSSRYDPCRPARCRGRMRPAGASSGR